MNFTVTSDAGCPAKIRHVVRNGSSSWAIDGNAMRAGKVLYYGESRIVFLPVIVEKTL